MPTGGLSPGAETYGGITPLLRSILDAFIEARGDYLDSSVGTGVYVENMAFARVIWDAWRDCQRFQNQFDPLRLTAFLSRWEQIFGVVPDPMASEADRRRAIHAVFRRMGQSPTRQGLIDALNESMGSELIVGVINTPAASAVVHWPGNSFPNSWDSSVAYIAVQVQQPAAMSDEEFYASVNMIYPVLDAFAPAWVTYDWIRQGPNGAGFFLDDSHNLDNEAFDS